MDNIIYSIIADDRQIKNLFCGKRIKCHNLTVLITTDACHRPSAVWPCLPFRRLIVFGRPFEESVITRVYPDIFRTTTTNNQQRVSVFYPCLLGGIMIYECFCDYISCVLFLRSITFMISMEKKTRGPWSFENALT